MPAVLEQKVVGREAHRAWRFLLLKYGEPAPGPAPAGMRVVPPPRTWARVPSWDWHRAGVEGVRARTIITAAAVAARLEEALDLDPAEADRRLRSLPGIGAWTSAEIRQRAMGDPDAVSVGDYHLPNAVGWTLARRKTDDAGMLELLAPYAGHRYRVTRLIELGGSPPAAPRPAHARPRLPRLLDPPAPPRPRRRLPAPQPLEPRGPSAQVRQLHALGQWAPRRGRASGRWLRKVRA